MKTILWKTSTFFQGDLNADYAIRVTNFLKMYEKKLAPEVPNPADPANPLFKGYQVTETGSFKSAKNGLPQTQII